MKKICKLKDSNDKLEDLCCNTVPPIINTDSDNNEINLKGEFTLVLGSSKTASKRTIDENIRKQTKKILIISLLAIWIN